MPKVKLLRLPNREIVSRGARDFSIERYVASFLIHCSQNQHFLFLEALVSTLTKKTVDLSINRHCLQFETLSMKTR